MSEEAPVPPDLLLKSQLDGIRAHDDFYKIETAIKCGELIIDVLLAPPRTGSTAAALYIARELAYDGVILEPEAWFGESERRIIVVCQQIDQMLDQLKNEKPRSGAYRILLKTMTNQFGTMSDIQAMMDLAHKMILLVRNPVRSFEDALLYKSRLVQAFGNGPVTLSDLKESGLISAYADLSHIRNPHPDGKTAWEQHVDFMDSTRDYTSLTPDILNSTHKLDQQAAFQREVFSWLHWHSPRRTGSKSLHDETYLAYLEGNTQQATPVSSDSEKLECWEQIVDQGLDQWEGARQNGQNSVEISSLPPALQSLFTGWHLGWNMLSGFQWGMVTRQQDIIPDKREIPFQILDFDTLVEDQHRILAEISKYFSVPQREDKSDPLVINSYLSDSHGRKVAAVAFAQATTDKVLRPLSTPILPINQFPPFIHVHLRNALTQYVDLMAKQKIREYRHHDPEFFQKSGLVSTFRRMVSNPDPLRNYVNLQAKDLLVAYRVLETFEKIFEHDGHPAKQYLDMAKIIPSVLMGHWNRHRQKIAETRRAELSVYFTCLDLKK